MGENACSIGCELCPGGNTCCEIMGDGATSGGGFTNGGEDSGEDVGTGVLGGEDGTATVGTLGATGSEEIEGESICKRSIATLMSFGRAIMRRISNSLRVIEGVTDGIINSPLNS